MRLSQTAMSSFGWLHLSDLHVGMPGYGLHWPLVRKIFYDDLKELTPQIGSWDCVFFTGDLTYSGREFTALDETLQDLWGFLTELNQGRAPELLAVPGNHDLEFPDENDLAVIGLESWNRNPRVRELFWQDDSGFRRLVERAFERYTRWVRNWTAQRNDSMKPRFGLLPGDFSASTEKNGWRIGVVGFNTAFLQMTRGDYRSKLALGLQQLNGVCGPDSPRWMDAHDIRFLLTHHPPEWLDDLSRSILQTEIAPAGCFHAHLFGHMHEGDAVMLAVGGGKPYRLWQGASLFGLAEYRSEGEAPHRIHGYSAGRIELPRHGPATMRLWPRVARCLKDGWIISRHDDRYRLASSDGGTQAEAIERGSTGPPGSGRQPDRIPLLGGRGPTAPTVSWPNPRTAAAIPNFFDLADLLHQLVVEAEGLVKGDGCSIFLYDEDADRFVLRESTVMTPFIGKYALDLTRDVDQPGCGITTRAAARGESRVIVDVRDDCYWSFRDPPSNPFEHFEVERERLRSMIVVSIVREDTHVAGVLRLVRAGDTGKGPFQEDDLSRVKRLVADNVRGILGTLALGRLLESGSILDEEQLCDESARVLAQMINGKGCSVFLLDEERADHGELVYRCRGTTGLTPESADVCYELPADAQRFVTALSAERKRNIVIDDVSDYDFGALGLKRQPGRGKTAESVPGGYKLATGPMMVTPLLSRERFDRDTRALGVIRVTRPGGLEVFDEGEQRRFFAFAERFSKTIRQLRFIGLMKDLAVPGDLKAKYAKVVRRVPRLLGGKGCSLFTGSERLQMQATSGALEERLRSKRIAPYLVADHDNRGYTGAAAALRHEIVWNDDAQRRMYDAEGVRASGRGECEIDSAPGRFLAVPIMAGDEAVGVIRIPKTAAECPFSWYDVQMLWSIANQLGRSIAELRER